MLIRILRYEPFCHEAAFRKFFQRKKGDDIGEHLQRLKIVLKGVM